MPTTLSALFSDVATAIRAVKGTSDEIPAGSFSSEILSIPSGASQFRYQSRAYVGIMGLSYYDK